MREFLETVEDHLCAAFVVAVLVGGIMGAIFGRRG